MINRETEKNFIQTLSSWTKMAALQLGIFLIPEFGNSGMNECPLSTQLSGSRNPLVLRPTLESASYCSSQSPSAQWPSWADTTITSRRTPLGFTIVTLLGVLGVRWAPVMGFIPSAGSAVSAVSVSPNNAIRASTAAQVLLQLVAHIWISASIIYLCWIL